MPIAAAIGAIVAGYFYYISRKPSVAAIPNDFNQWAWLFLVIFPPLSALCLWLASLIGKKIAFIYQMAKYMLVGAAIAVFDLGLLNLFMNLFNATSGAIFNAAKGASFVAAATLKYFPDKFWTFENKNKKNLKKEFGGFFGISLAGLALNVVAADLIVNRLGPQWQIAPDLWANLGGIVATLAVFVFTFFACVIFVFKK